MSEEFQIDAASVNLTSPEEGDTEWVVEQSDVDPDLDIPNSARLINWSFGPIRYYGYIDTDTLEITVAPTLAGCYIGLVNGNLKDGLGLKNNLFVIVGSLKWYLKNGNELWTHIDQKVKFDGNFEGDYKIISW